MEDTGGQGSDRNSTSGFPDEKKERRSLARDLEALSVKEDLNIMMSASNPNIQLFCGASVLAKPGATRTWKEARRQNPSRTRALTHTNTNDSLFLRHPTLKALRSIYRFQSERNFEPLKRVTYI